MRFNETVKSVLEAKEAPRGMHYTKSGNLRKGGPYADGNPDGGPFYKSDPTYVNPNESNEDHEGIYYAHLCGTLESKLEDMADILMEQGLIEGVTGRLVKSLCSRHIEDAKQKSKEYSTQ